MNLLQLRIAANAIKTNVCQRNPGLPNCDKTLKAPAGSKPVPAGSCN